GRHGRRLRRLERDLGSKRLDEARGALLDASQVRLALIEPALRSSESFLQLRGVELADRVAELEFLFFQPGLIVNARHLRYELMQLPILGARLGPERPGLLIEHARA